MSRHDPEQILKTLCKPGSKSFEILLRHGEAVGRKSVKIARRLRHLHPDLDLVWEASVLHDAGVLETDSPSLGCFGKHPYICHGFLGKSLLEQIDSEKLKYHGLVCERHVGVGLTLSEIAENGFPLPRREMMPISLEEKIVCYADKFFSKKGDDICDMNREKGIWEVCVKVSRYGKRQLDTFMNWAVWFEPDALPDGLKRDMDFRETGRGFPSGGRQPRGYGL